MYNDNIRNIQQLNDSNNIIRDAIINRTNLPNNVTENTQQRNRNRSRNRNRQPNNYNISNNRNNLNYYTPNYYTPNYYMPNNYIPSYYAPIYYNYRTSNETPTSLLHQRTYTPLTLRTLRRQIELATQNVRYGDLVSPRHTICPISHEPFNENSQVTVIRYCGHIFNTLELNTWFSNHYICPVCRYDIRNYRRNNNSSSQLDLSNNLLEQRDGINSVLFVDISYNMVENDSIANDVLNIFNAFLI
jgi:hypothetical protein